MLKNISSFNLDAVRHLGFDSAASDDP